jgi:hypothetical protein
MRLAVLLDQRIFVTYSQAWVFPGDDQYDSDYDIESVFDGQANGLCGAAEPGVLLLITATHTGEIPFRIEYHDSEPRLADEWEDVVEVSYSVTESRTGIIGLDDEQQHELALPRGSYRARYCVSGLDAQAVDGETLDAHLLQFWPAEPVADLIVRQSSDGARTRHIVPLPPGEHARDTGAVARRTAEVRRPRSQRPTSCDREHVQCSAGESGRGSDVRVVRGR